MTLVIDASVSVKWVVEEPGSAAARLVPPGDWIAPESWLSECANALWKKVRRRELDVDEARLGFAALIRTPMRLIPISTLVEAAWALALEVGHPVHDCLYVACAVGADCEVITADAALARRMARHPGCGARVRLLGA